MTKDQKHPPCDSCGEPVEAITKDERGYILRIDSEQGGAFVNKRILCGPCFNKERLA